MRDTALCGVSPDGENVLPFDLGESVPADSQSGPSDADSELAPNLDAAQGDGVASDWQQNTDPVRVVGDFTRLVSSIAHRRKTAGMPADDLYQIGMIEALKAAQRYDPTRGQTLRNYIWHKANFAIADAVRSDNRKRSRMQYWDSIGERGSSFYAGSFAQEGQDSDSYASKVQCTGGRGGGHEVISRLVDLWRTSVPEIDAVRLQMAIDRLSARKQEIIRLIYVVGYRQSEVGQMMEPPITRQRVHQIHEEALGELRNAFQRKEDGE